MKIVKSTSIGKFKKSELNKSQLLTVSGGSTTTPEVIDATTQAASKGDGTWTSQPSGTR
jgi:hypothetical protein